MFHSFLSLIMANKKKADAKSSYIVKQEFRDRDDFDTTHEAGDDVSHFDQSLLDDLVVRGLVEAPAKAEPQALAPPVTPPADPETPVA